MLFEKYQQNLKLKNDTIYSYGTRVAIIHSDVIEELGYWSKTTRKHINYVSVVFNKPVNFYDKHLSQNLISK
tara:strand:+ start:7734 stop:7949 length:216 start_codon:yes stop_codon:yes gene_type:complete